MKKMIKITPNQKSIQRFMKFVSINKLSGCWLWTGYAKPGRGGSYGGFTVGQRTVMAYRFSYAAFVGELNDGLVIDHLCRVQMCVNPKHLEQVESRTNTLRGISVTSKNAVKTHCKNGHPFNVKNTIGLNNNGRGCRRCGADQALIGRYGYLPESSRRVKHYKESEVLK